MFKILGKLKISHGGRKWFLKDMLKIKKHPNKITNCLKRKFAGILKLENRIHLSFFISS